MGYPSFDKGEERIAELEHEVKDLEEQYMGLQMMLAFILKTTGPVSITRELMENGIHKGAGISLEDDAKSDTTIVKLIEPVDEQV